jgi:hypothetical protein
MLNGLWHPVWRQLSLEVSKPVATWQSSHWSRILARCFTTKVGRGGAARKRRGSRREGKRAQVWEPRVKSVAGRGDEHPVWKKTDAQGGGEAAPRPHTWGLTQQREAPRSGTAGRPLVAAEMVPARVAGEPAPPKNFPFRLTGPPRIGRLVQGRSAGPGHGSGSSRGENALVQGGRGRVCAYVCLVRAVKKAQHSAMPSEGLWRARARARVCPSRQAARGRRARACVRERWVWLLLSWAQNCILGCEQRAQGA